ncbi:MarR family winged helix-turn-helix transcriptional regulator [Streptomyces sp. NPDC006879]|uniref:MarR family winged helix-turn-helix transcriptional regulator n=1 Tax=Streptomyces sp. NPDC006879 TaxID=3364767 RepID=UPI00368DF5AC
MSTRPVSPAPAPSASTRTRAKDMADQTAPERVRGLPSRLLSLTTLQAERLVGAGLATENVRTWHFVVLVALTEAGPASQSTLSRRTGVHRSDMVAVINDLTERGLVQRAPDPEDRRRNVITVTTEGRSQLRRLDEIINAAQDELLAPLSQAERGQLTELLRRVLDHHVKAAHHEGK